MKAKPSPFPNAKIPRHVAIIMDGNGRWAKAKGLPRVAGHREGVENVREAVRTCTKLGIPYLTLYAFSQENWKRPKEEVSILMNLLDYFIDQEVKNFMKEGISLRAIGRLEALPSRTHEKLRQAIRTTAANEKLVLTIALNYGSRAEILDAVESLMKENVPSLTEEVFSKHLYTRDLPDPDLLIRTSGEMRLSNFLLWQLSYAEIYISKKYWPDFKRADFLKAVREYGKRERRFGDVCAAQSQAAREAVKSV